MLTKIFLRRKVRKIKQVMSGGDYYWEGEDIRKG
jgi:hypothetical protein